MSIVGFSVNGEWRSWWTITLTLRQKPFQVRGFWRRYCPKYVSKEALDAKVKEARFDNWVNLFKFKNDWARNPELPVLTPWKTTTPITTPTWVLERNPYSIWVDTE